MKRPVIVERRTIPPRNAPRRAANGGAVREVTRTATTIARPPKNEPAAFSGALAREVAKALRYSPFRFPRDWTHP